MVYSWLAAVFSQPRFGRKKEWSHNDDYYDQARVRSTAVLAVVCLYICLYVCLSVCLANLGGGILREVVHAI